MPFTSGQSPCILPLPGTVQVLHAHVRAHGRWLSGFKMSGAHLCGRVTAQTLELGPWSGNLGHCDRRRRSSQDSQRSGGLQALHDCCPEEAT